MWAFFDPNALTAWWQTSRSVTVPRVLGAYAVECVLDEIAEAAARCFARHGFVRTTSSDTFSPIK